MSKLSTHILRPCAALLLFAAAICTAPKLVADELQLLWQQSPADGLPYLGTGNTERGVAINPATGHVLLVSRASNEIHIFNGETGEELGLLNKGDGIITGGTFAISLIGVADDGAIYVANLTTGSAGSPFKIYRWESETAEAPTIAYEGDPSEGDAATVRWGDSLDVRGSGLNTQLIAGSGGSGSVGALFTTEDGVNFTHTRITNIAANSVAFGAGNSVWTKRSGSALRQVSFDPATGEGTVLVTVPSTVVPNGAVGLGVNASSNWLAAISVNTAVDDLRLYDIRNPEELGIIDQENFPADNANGNAAGTSDLQGDILVAVDTNNGLVAYRVVPTVTVPFFTTQPADLTILEGGSGAISANVAGSAPITFQWQHEGTNVPAATDSAFQFASAALSQAGTYTLIASNAAGAVTSNPVVVSIQGLVKSDRTSILWRLAPGERPYLTADGNTERGIAYNKVSNRVLVVTRQSGANIHVLDGDSGADLWTLQAPTDVVTGSNPSGFRLNMIAVADDGVVYAANLDTGGSTYAIYRWDDDTTNSLPTVAWSGAPISGRRFGDTLDVRGAGANTQILVGNNNSGAAEPDNLTVIMTTTDGFNFAPITITTPGVDDDAFRLGVGFGAGDTFWGKAPAQPLRQVQFNLETGEGTVLLTATNVPSLSTAVSAHASSNLVAVLALENPDNVRIYEPAGEELTLVDQELFATDNANANGTGSADFGNDRLYVLDTNNGILALKLGGGGTEAGAATLSNAARTANGFAFTLTGTPNAAYQIQSTTDFQTWTTESTVTAAASGSVEVTLNSAADHHRFFRAVAQ